MTMKLFPKPSSFLTTLSMLGLCALLCALFTSCRGLGPETSDLHNTLTAREKADGWRLLWDGKTTDGWRSPKSDEFPTKSWLIENGEFRVLPGENANAEAQAGGDIITRKRYSNFELS